MNIYIDWAFAMGIFGLLFLNTIFHLIGFQGLTDPFSMGSVMTIFTSLSFGLLAFYLYLSDDEENADNRFHLLHFALVPQVLSLGLHNLDSFNPTLSFFQPSAIPTSINFFFVLLVLFLLEKRFLPKKVEHFVGPVFFLTCLFFTYAFIGKKFYLLGISQQKLGVGFSFYSLVCFYLISFAVMIKHTKIIRLYQLKIGYKPVFGMISVILYGTMNYLLTFCESKGVHFISLLTQISFIGLCYFFFFSPFHALQDKFITICSWTRQVKGREENWLETEELFSSLGLTVTHGISKEHYEKIRNRPRKQAHS